MKRTRIVIILLIVISIILVGIFFVSKLHSNKVNENLEYKSNENLEYKSNEILDYIIFKRKTYVSIDDVVFYDKDADISDEEINNLTIIAGKLKLKHPGKSIVYLRKLGSSFENVKAEYRCKQIVNGQVLENAEMNIYLKDDDEIELIFLSRSSWKKGTNTENIKITQEKAEQILVDYFIENPNDFNVIKAGRLSFGTVDDQLANSKNETCIIELYVYNSKTAWRMEFLNSGGYMFIDANTGEILYKNFTNGNVIWT
ncbi:MAG: hypothetical protein J6A15_09205 [Clostridia bacterium]|nr:hypothetical protein [Clostridia bacterium]